MWGSTPLRSHKKARWLIQANRSNRTQQRVSTSFVSTDCMWEEMILWSRFWFCRQTSVLSSVGPRPSGDRFCPPPPSPEIAFALPKKNLDKTLESAETWQSRSRQLVYMSDQPRAGGFCSSTDLCVQTASQYPFRHNPLIFTKIWNDGLFLFFFEVLKILMLCLILVYL